MTRTDRGAAWRMSTTDGDARCDWCGTSDGRIRPVQLGRQPTGLAVCDPCGDAGACLTLAYGTPTTEETT